MFASQLSVHVQVWPQQVFNKNRACGSCLQQKVSRLPPHSQRTKQHICLVLLKGWNMPLQYQSMVCMFTSTYRYTRGLSRHDGGLCKCQKLPNPSHLTAHGKAFIGVEKVSANIAPLAAYLEKKVCKIRKHIWAGYQSKTEYLKI